MNKYNTRDITIRKALIDKLGHNNRRIRQEFALDGGSNRVDIAVIGDTIHGYELKGDRDNLLRLEQQRNTYNNFFDKVTLVVGKSHILEALHIIPEWWGIIIAKSTSQGIDLVEVREAKSNPDQDTFTMVSMLWKSEMLQLLDDYNLPTKHKYDSKYNICKFLVHTIDEYELKSRVKNQISIRYSSNSQFL